MDYVMKRSRKPWDYDEKHSGATRSRKRRKSIPEFSGCSAQQRQIFEVNSMYSPLLRLPAEIRNEIYGHVLANNVIHVSVRECSEDDPGACKQSAYWRGKKHCRFANSSPNAFLRFTHSFCTLPFDAEHDAHIAAQARKSDPGSPTSEEKTSYHIRHKSCYRAIAHLKGNWIREEDSVSVSPFYKPPSSPGLAVQFRRTCRQIYTETHDMIYTLNTFAFHEGNSLDLFLSKGLSPIQSSLITSVQLDGWQADSWDPGTTVRPAMLQRLTGLKTLLVAVTNVHGHHMRLHLAPNAGVVKGVPWKDIRGKETEAGRGKRGIVKVTVDRTASGWSDPAELEGMVKRNVEAYLGFIT